MRMGCSHHCMLYNWGVTSVKCCVCTYKGALSGKHDNFNNFICGVCRVRIVGVGKPI